MPRRPVEPEGAAPVMKDERDVIPHPDPVQKLVQAAAVLGEGVDAGTRVREFVRVSHSDEVRRDAATTTRNVGNDVPPQIGRGRVAVQEHDRRAGARLDIRHLHAVAQTHELLRPSNVFAPGKVKPGATKGERGAGSAEPDLPASESGPGHHGWVRPPPRRR